MLEFPKEIKFKYNWRKYQQRVLDELQEHIDDKHLHVVAPPGSGKTILGLEVAIRINKPTLILAPTVAIRNQWIQRFCELFLQTGITPDWVSRDIRNPSFLTVVTYQGLHAACSNRKHIEEESVEEEKKDDCGENSKASIKHINTIVDSLKAVNIGTIVIDEAHHLKNEWWTTLTKVKESLSPIIVGLTATPPYDVTFQEWERYLELNGPVDAEISVPELVIEGDLCPHQDYIYFTSPSDAEHQKISEFRERTLLIFNQIKADPTLIEAISGHPAVQNPKQELDWIYTNLSYYSASIIFLKAVGSELDKIHLKVIGDSNIKIPPFDFEWAETLLVFYLYEEKEHFKNYEEHRKGLENKLRHNGIIEKKKICFSHNSRVTSSLSTSISKLNSVKEIVNFEYSQLKEKLRLVVLTDYIRQEFLVNSDVNYTELNKIGVVPIFEILRRDNSDNKKIGVLTGSLIVIPKSALIPICHLGENYGLKIGYSTLAYDDDYLVLTQSDQSKHLLVHFVTEVFQRGEIEVLIGTKSLLGEGWDAPAINALILASFVGSFVLSNQMRGRAIRTEKGNINKTGNIWHLVCVDPTSPTGGEDLELLQRRFKGFVGITSSGDPGIENGVERLKLPIEFSDPNLLSEKNTEILRLAAERDLLKQRWQTALEKGVTLVEEIKIPFQEERGFKEIKSLYFNKTIAYLVAELMFGLMVFGETVFQSFFRSLRNIRSLEDFYRWLSIMGIVGLVLVGKQLYKTFNLYIRYRDIAKDIHQIGEALVMSLIEASVIKTNISKLEVVSTLDSMGSVFCHLEGGTTFEKSSFINSLQEIIAPIDNPKYVIIRKSKLGLIRQKDYHSVPEVLSKNKKLAEYLKTHWERLVGNCELVFTRTLEGRKLLLTSRVKSLASKFQSKAEHVNKWR